MAAMTALTTSDPFSVAGSLRHPEFGGNLRKIPDPIVEPRWEGLHVLVASDGRSAAMFDGGGPIDVHDDLLDAFRATIATTADGVVAEGWLTRQVAAGDVGTYTGPDAPSATTYIGTVLLGSRSGRRQEATERLEAAQAARAISAGDPVDLVVVDLVWLDGTPLFDLPLQERKRLLESVVPATDRIRPGIHVRPPIDTWVGSWRAQGFSGLTFKAANSRYRPGEPAADWATVPMPRR